jgi:predicted hydrocarbon binding protein
MPLDQNDPELYAQMQRRLEALGDGGFLDGMHEFLARYERDEPLRPTLPNKMQFLYMRDRQTFSFALMPELIPIAYQVGRMIGMAFDAPRREGVTLREALESAIDVAEAFGYGRQEIVTVEENFAVYRTYECADCYGMPNIGMKICPYEAGTAAGALEKTLGRPVRVVEVKCCANGDPYDEFEVYVD